MSSLPLPPDPYKTLGVSKDAQVAEIRSAYRKLVLKCHPDKVQVQDPQLKAEKQDEFQRVQQAYELLSNDKERSMYDDKVKLADLKKQKANSSATRQGPRYTEFEVRTAEPRPPMFKSSSSGSTKIYFTTAHDEDFPYGTRIFETEIRTKRNPSYSSKASRRETDRERDRDRYNDRERERERRKRDDNARRAEKADRNSKEARREKKSREKRLDKEIKRSAEEKKRPSAAYVEELFEERLTPRSDKKKYPAGTKYEDSREKERERDRKADRDRERSTPRERSAPLEPSPSRSPPTLPRATHDWSSDVLQENQRYENAASYIQASKVYPHGKVYYSKFPTAPSPPPVNGQAFAMSDEENSRRSSARLRRDSADSIPSPRERSYRRSSERLDDPPLGDANPPLRRPSYFQKSKSSMPAPEAVPRRDLPRQNTMPAEPTFSRVMPGIPRASTFSSPGGGSSKAAGPRGRSRSRMEAQVDEETESDDEEYERRAREFKQRSSRRQRSPEDDRVPEQVRRYQVNDGRTQLATAYTRKLDPEDSYRGYAGLGHPGARVEGRVMPSREPSHRARFTKVHESPSYSYDDAQYSTYHTPLAAHHQERVH